jgi:hypothetical protein
MKTLDHEDALGLRFDSDAGDNSTIRQYLYALLSTLWEEGEGFSGKRPFGNSGWESDLYSALAKGGYVKGDSEGYVERGPERDKARAIVSELIHFAIYGYAPPKA